MMQITYNAKMTQQLSTIVFLHLLKIDFPVRGLTGLFFGVCIHVKEHLGEVLALYYFFARLGYFLSFNH